MRKGLLGGVVASVALLAGTAADIAAPEEVERKVPTARHGHSPSYARGGVPPMAYLGGRGPIKRNKAKRWHAKRLAKKGK